MNTHIPNISFWHGRIGHRVRWGWHALTILGFALLFVVLFTMIVPYNMDEFLYYDTILCHLYPGNNLHGVCDPFQLNLFGTTLTVPLRSYHYVGSFPALYFLPIILLWQSPLAARLLGMVFLMAGGLLAARVFSFKPKIVVPALILTFPYLFQHLVDTGPVGIQILLVFLLYVLLDRWCAWQHWRTVGIIVLLTFLGIWTKPSFFWFAPGLIVFLLAHAARRRKLLFHTGRLRLFFLQGVCAACALAALLALLLLSTDPGNHAAHPFIEQLLQSSSYSFSEIVRGAWLSAPSFFALLHPLEATQRVFFVLPAPWLSALFCIVHYLFVPCILLLLFVFAHRSFRRSLLLPAALYVSFLLTVLMIVRTKDAWAMHHAILSYPFLILSVLATVRCALEADASRPWFRIPLALFAGAFITVNILLYVVFPIQEYQVHSTPEKHLVQRIINSGTIPGRTMVLALDWGMFYYSGLFGSPEKSVLFEWGMRDTERMRYLRELAASHGRKLVFLSSPKDTSVDLRLFQRSIPLESCAATPPDADWVMLFEPDEEIREVCRRYAAAAAHPSLVRRLLLQASLTR